MELYRFWLSSKEFPSIWVSFFLFILSLPVWWIQTWYKYECYVKINSWPWTSLQEIYKDANTQVHTLRKMVKEKEEAIQRQSTLEKKIHELEKQGTIKIQKKGDGDIAILPVVASGTLSMGSEVVAGNSVGPTTGAASSGPLPPPPPPLPLSSDTPETGKKPWQEDWGSFGIFVFLCQLSTSVLCPFLLAYSLRIGFLE